MAVARIFLTFFCFATLASSATFAQSTVRAATSQVAPQAVSPTVSVRNPSGVLPPGELRLNVFVADKAGHPNTSLPQTSFVLQANGHAIPILSFRAPSPADAATATQVILVIDAVNVGINTVEYEREQIEHFLRGNDGQLAVPASIVIFTDTASRMQQAPSQDGNALADDLKKQVVGLRELRRNTGFWGASERYDLSLRTLQQLLTTEAGRPGHKLILWISPGWPYLSGPGINLDRKQEEGFFRSVVETSRLLMQSQVTLYSIDPLGVSDAGGFRTIYYENFLKGVEKPSNVDPADLSLQVLATHSGGHVAYGSNDVAKSIARAFADAGNFYTITAQLPAAEQPDTYNNLELKVEAPGLIARTTTGYYTQP